MSALSPAVSTPTPSIRDQAPPIITFVGRPAAWEKGLDVLLTALETLDARTSTPFQSWIIGGGDDDLKSVESWLTRSTGLMEMVQSGRLMFWGRVAADSLPEVFSRSAVTVMPSRYEPFGIVAIEAMACGSPLVASAVNGLGNLVLPRYTGHAVPADDAEALAWTLSGFLRRGGQRPIMARQAAQWGAAFSMDAVVARFRDLYAGKSLKPPHPIENTSGFIRDSFGHGQWRPKDDAAAIVNVEYKNNTVFHLETASGPKIFKTFSAVPVADATLFCLPFGLRPLDAQACLAKAQYYRNVRWTAPVEGVTHDPPGLTMDALSPADVPARHLHALRPLLAEVRATARPSREAEKMLLRAWHTLYATRSRDALDAFDIVAAQMQAPIVGSTDVFQRTHPGAELLRIFIHIEERTWPLEARQRQAVTGICSTAVERFPASFPAPLLCHGDFMARHLLRREDRVVLCDLDDLRFAVGGIDEAFWITFEVLLKDGAAAATWAWEEIRRLEPEDSNWRTTIALWIIAMLVFYGLWCAMRGNLPRLDQCLKIASAFSESWLLRS